MNRHSRAKSIGLIAFLVIVWGLCWPVYKVALAYTPPLLFAGMRTLLGGVLLTVVLLPRWKQMHFRKTWHICAISGLFNAGLFYGIQTVGLEYLPEGLFSVIVYLQPVLLGLFAWMWLGESMSLPKMIGLLLGFLGVAAVSADGFSGHISVTGILLALITAVSWAVGVAYVKKVGSRVDAMWLVAIQCVMAGSVLTAAGLLAENWFSIVWNLTYIGGLTFGGILGIAAAWIVYFNLVKAGEASKVGAYTFLVPLIAVFIGTLFLHEPFTIYLVVGLVLIVLSIYLVNRTPKQRIQAASAQVRTAIIHK